ncbi:MAG: SLBB domain-containing protein [Nitrospirae bacterium]|nr:SLBB domain-containing protein [Nitrospirota bacterium]
MKVRLFLVISLILIFTGKAFAQQIQATPVYPQGQQSERELFIQQPILQVQPQAVPPSQTQPVPLPSLEKTSEFEQHISEKIEITDTQFEILQKLEGITFSYISHPPAGSISVPVKVVKRLEKTETPETANVTVGYVIGTPEAVTNAFKLVGIRSALTVSTDIKQFGYDLFRNPPSTFAPVEKVPVGPDYVMGPGDEIKVAIWGKVEGLWSVVVDRDGHISLPKVGILGVTGLTFKELKELLNKEFSKYYTGFEMNVSMGALRTIMVYVVGNAEKPGAYTVSALSTLINALFEAGGPSKTGTMRNIQLKRNGKTTVIFDMYDFLLKGDKTKDIRLMPEDVIFIESAGPLVAVAGSVNNPAIYEIKEEKTVSRLIEMAGGLSTVAFKGRVQIERIIDNTRQTVFESDIAGAKDMSIQAGDVVKIFQVVQDRRLVRVSGAVQREGEYGFRTGMSLKDLLSLAGGLKYYAFNKEAELTRVYVTDNGPKTEKLMVDIGKALAGDPEGNIPLKEDDYLFVRTVPEWQLYRIARISGEVKFPGSYTIQKGEKLSSLIERAGGYTDKAHLRGAVFIRERVRDMQQKSLEEMILRLERELLAEGSVQVSAALSTEEIQAKKVEQESKQKFIESLKKIKATGRMTLRLAHLRLLKGTASDVEIENNDSLFIPARNNVVNVTGAVMAQSSLVYSDKMDYKDYIEMSGSYSRHADTDNVYILKVDGSARKASKRLINWNPFSSRWEAAGFGSDVKPVEPGDTIVVPEKLDRIAWLREIKDITQILFQIAVTTGVVYQLL